MLLAVSVFLLLFLLPSYAFAFGPCVHLNLASSVIAQTLSLGLPCALVILKNQKAFFLGNLDPDRVILKNLASYKDHSHNWQRAMKNLREVKKESEKALMLGYLCHLAADVVAHNYFVPYKMVEFYGYPLARHVYWEMRLDAMVASMFSVRSKDLGLNDREHILELKRFVPTHLFKPTINYKITGAILKIGDLYASSKMGRLWTERSSLGISEEEKGEVLRLALSAQISVLRALEHAKVTSLDPRGIHALKTALRMRAEFRRGSVRREDACDRARSVFLKPISLALGTDVMDYTLIQLKEV